MRVGVVKLCGERQWWRLLFPHDVRVKTQCRSTEHCELWSYTQNSRASERKSEKQDSGSECWPRVESKHWRTVFTSASMRLIFSREKQNRTDGTALAQVRRNPISHVYRARGSGNRCHARADAALGWRLAWPHSYWLPSLTSSHINRWSIAPFWHQ